MTTRSESSCLVTCTERGASVYWPEVVRSAAWVPRDTTTLTATRMPITTALTSTLSVPKRVRRVRTRSRTADGSTTP